ncbi:MAG: DUF559 domain-containing protein [Thermoguttaceae bacterium]|nr:DUF559 domain-containing protein [Thermoguttaceae bacterium]
MENSNRFTGYNSAFKSYARQLRRDMTRFERHLWHDFLKKYPVKFYRQRIIDHYIADFYCSSAKLIVELDGIQHTYLEAQEEDRVRSEVLENYGLLVLRFSNDEIDKNFQGVCHKIHETVEERLEYINNIGFKSEENPS